MRPGTPPPDPLVVGKITYLLHTVGSWSDPEDRIAVYGLTRTYDEQHGGRS